MELSLAIRVHLHSARSILLLESLLGIELFRLRGHPYRASPVNTPLPVNHSILNHTCCLFENQASRHISESGTDDDQDPYLIRKFFFKGSFNNQFVDLSQHVLSKSLTKMNIHGWIEWMLISKLRKPNEILKLWILFDLKDRFLVT